MASPVKSHTHERSKTAESLRRYPHWLAWSTCALLVGGLLQGAFFLDRYTQSDAFCGQTCHSSMAPQNAAHLAGSHADTPCVGCHVGKGLSGHLRAKVRGIEHVVSQLSGNYARPIRVTDTQQRVPDDRCLTCHSLSKIPEARQLQVPRYLYDRANSAWQVSLTLHIGAYRTRPDPVRGIMWHMAEPGRVRFATPDPTTQTIPWVQVLRTDGSTTTYVARATSLSPIALEQLPRRSMTCADCHNRIGHDLPHPDAVLDRALFNGQLATSLRSVKRRVGQAVAEQPAARHEALDLLQDALAQPDQNPDAPTAKFSRSNANLALVLARNLVATAVYPHLGVEFATYPSHVGHRFSLGCFRCHDGAHFDAAGKAIANDCATTCHTAPRLAPIDPTAREVTEPWHPWHVPALVPAVAGHDRLSCADCHVAGLVPKLSCEDCHHPPGL